MIYTFVTLVINFITEKDEYLATAFKTAIENNKPLDAYFSRHRGLRRRIKRGGMSDSEEEVMWQLCRDIFTLFYSISFEKGLWAWEKACWWIMDNLLTH